MEISRGAAVTESLIARLQARATRQNQAADPSMAETQAGFLFLADGVNEDTAWDFVELDRRARFIASALTDAGVDPGECCLLLFAPGLDFIAAFFGCLYAGVAAVPAYPPRQSKGLQRLAAIVKDAEPAAVMTDAALWNRRETWCQSLPELNSCPWINGSNVTDGAVRWEPEPVDACSLAFLQYTSGSTALPKGVMVSHENLMANLAAIQRAFDQGPSTTVVGWLPFYHDMGLIGNVLQTVYAGSRCVLMPPMAFLRKPLNWLRAIDRYRATTSGGPNFAYDLCVQKIALEDRNGLDLSSWRSAFNGAEPVRSDTLRRFERAFVPHGFSPRAWFPCYGLAEHTLFVSGGPINQGASLVELDEPALQNHRIKRPQPNQAARTLVSCGRIAGDQTVKIIDPDTSKLCAEDRIGEIWLRGPGKAQGYWRQQTATKHDFRASIDGEGDFLRTGDLGFIHNGQLVITGRLKDLIIVRGRNYYPHDLEASLNGLHPLLKAGRGAAFAIETGQGEAVVIVHETTRRRPDAAETSAAANAIRQQIGESFDLTVADVVLIRAGLLPLTSSGKVRRHACRQTYIDGGFERLDAGSPAMTRTQSPPSVTPTLTREMLAAMPNQVRQANLATYLKHTLARLVKQDADSIRVDLPVTALGLDSLSAVDFHAQVERDLGAAPSVQQLLEGACLETIATNVLKTMADKQVREALARVDGDCHPLSHGQRALWFLQKMLPDTTAFILTGIARLNGVLNPAAMQHALKRVVARHAALRTTFEEVDGEPHQRIHDVLEPEFVVLDLREASSEEVRQQAESIALAPFDLEQSSPIRCALLRETDQSWLIVLAQHHLVSDFWSIGLLLTEWERCYREELGGEAAALPDSPHGFADAVHARLTMLDGPRGKALWQWWRNQLNARPMQLALPTERPRPNRWSGRGGYVTARLKADTVTQLSHLAKMEQTTLYTVLLSGFASLLRRLSGQRETLIGTPTTGRESSTLHGIMGYFINPMVIVADTRKNPAFQTFLGEMRGTVLDALRHREFPFPLLAERLQPQRDSGRSPVFQVFFVMEQAKLLHERGLSAFALGDGSASARLFDHDLQALPIERRDAQFDLMLLISRLDDELVMSLEYAADLFDRETAQCMLAAYTVLLEHVTNHPSTPVHRLPLLNKAQRQNLIRELPRLERRTLNAHVLDAMQRAPQAPAVILDLDEWNYQTLVTRAWGIAHALRQAGAASGSPVGLCLPRDLDLIAAMFGILEAGCCYVPLDPTYPADRLAYLAEDALGGQSVPLLIADSKTADAFGHVPNMVILDPRAIEPAEEPPQVVTDVDQTAYIIYTSGSTGQPKGVPISHGNVSRLLAATHPFDFSPDDVWTLFHAYAFDFSVWEIWGALAHGSSLVIVPWDTARDPAAFAQLLRTEGITVLNQTPSAFRHLLPQLVEQPAPSLRWIIFGGEALDPSLIKGWYATDLPGKLVNMYGITETCVHVTFTELTAADGERESAPLGEPIDDLAVVLCDDAGEAVPDTLPGEIYVAGAGLSRGYWQRPGLTAERFVPNPFAAERDGGSRLYRSGDVARVRSDIGLVFSGRADGQIKLRGFRIEPGEIEACLASHDSVNDAVVRLRKSERGEALTAWYTGGGAAEDVRQHARQKLPDHMVPNDFVAIDQWPLTANGKLDLQALPAPDSPASEAGQELPQTDVERQLAAMWQALLQVEAVGRQANFFELGGHSLLAARLTAMMRERFGSAPPISVLFEQPTLAALAATIEPDVSHTTHAAEPVITPRPDQAFEPFPLTDIQQAYWIGRRGGFELGNIATHVYFEIEAADLDLTRLDAAWRQLVQRHPMLRTVFTADGQQRVLEQVPDYAIAVMDLRNTSQEVRDRHFASLRRKLSHQILATDRFPIFEIAATRYDRDRVRLHISFDALIADAWSMLLLFREWSQLYRQPESRLPELDLSFRDYVLAERALRDSEAYVADWAYWEARLETLPPAPDLPLAKDPGHIETPRFVRHQHELSAPVWQLLKTRTASAGLTPSVVLLTVFAEVLAAWSKDPRFTINLTLFNRLPLHPRVNEIVGDFTTLTLLAVDHRGEAGFIARAKRLQQQLWRDLDHRHVGGLRILRELGRRAGDNTRARMPVVFTSALGMDELDPAKLELFGELGYGISQTPQVWLDHVVVERQGGLAYNWDVVADLFPKGLVEAMFAAYTARLIQLSEKESAWQKPAGSMLPAAQAKIRRTVNDTRKNLPVQPIHQPFFHRAAVNPDAPALLTADAEVTFGELAATAGGVAEALRQQGLRKGDWVVVALPKSPAQVAAVFGVLAAGGAYLPMDPTLPSARREAVLNQAGARLGLTGHEFTDSLQSHAKVTWLPMESIHAHPVEDSPDDEVALDDMAYVIFTSGSTGSPKGVMIDHLGAANTIADINRRFGVGSEDRVLSLSSLSFDLSVYDLFGVLGAGGAVVLPTAEKRRDPTHWRALMDRHRVTIWNTVPALMNMLDAHMTGATEPDEHLRLVLMSGDWIPVALPDRIRSWSKAELISLGGATEASIWSILHPIEEVDPTWDSIPYGQPMWNQQFYVLDANRRPRPDWVPGELFIGGIGLAKGYLGDAAKTSHAFVFEPASGERLYRTGDWGCMLPDGTIRFLGREDQQVKVGGYRIELGDITTALTDHPEVRDAAAVITGDPRGTRQITAFAVTHDAQAAGESNAEEPEVPPGASLTDPVQRAAFKLDRPGKRRFPKDAERHSLPIDEAAETAATDLSRQSYRSFLPRAVVAGDGGGWLACLRARAMEGAPLPKFRYPSAGSLNPVQTYLYIKPDRWQGLAGGFYGYDVDAHTLIQLSDQELAAHHYGPVHAPLFEAAGFALFLIADLSAIKPVYGDLARDFCLLEAGYMGQLLMTEAPCRDLGLCPIGYVPTEPLRPLLDLTDDHQVMHSFLGGVIDPRQTETWQQEDAVTAPADPAQALLDHLRKKLPAYMVPTHLHLLNELPLTANGKVDRKALQRLAGQPTAVSGKADAAPPKGQTEERLAALWSAVLDRDDVGRHQNFFELGGDSLGLVKIHQQLLAEAELADAAADLSVVDLFKHPTIADLAGRLNQTGQYRSPPSADTERADADRAAEAAAERARRQRQAQRRQTRHRQPPGRKDRS